MKIDLLIGSLNSGGAQRVLCTLANYFAKRGHQVRVITFREGERYTLDEGIQRIRFHKNLRIFNTTLSRAAYYLFFFYREKNNRPNVISAHIGMMGFPTIPIAKYYNIPIVVSEHTNHFNSPKTLAKKILWNVLYRYADAITILTNYDYQFFKRKNPNIHVVFNPNSFSPIDFSYKNRSKTILSIGNLDRYKDKGFDNLIEIASKVKKLHPEWIFKIVGEGNKGREFLEKKIMNLNLTNNVILTGYRADIANLLKDSSIYVLPSKYEGLPMGLMEAVSQGIACIAYDCISGPSDIIENGINGILVPDQNQEQMIEEILKLIENKELREILGSNAVKSCEKFSVEKIGQQWEELFISIQK